MFLRFIASFYDGQSSEACREIFEELKGFNDAEMNYECVFSFVCNCINSVLGSDFY